MKVPPNPVVNISPDHLWRYAWWNVSDLSICFPIYIPAFLVIFPRYPQFAKESPCLLVNPLWIPGCLSMDVWVKTPTSHWHPILPPVSLLKSQENTTVDTMFPPGFSHFHISNTWGFPSGGYPFSYYPFLDGIFPNKNIQKPSATRGSAGKPRGSPGLPAQVLPPQRRVEPHGAHGTRGARGGAQEAQQRPAQLLVHGSMAMDVVMGFSRI